MKIIKIFIASSINEFKSERNELARFVCGINNKFVERGIYCKLMLCENEDQAMPQSERKQDEYNALIADSDVVFVLFFEKAGKYTVEELELARNCYIKNGHPKVYTYFKDFDEAKMSEDVRAVYEKIVNEYRHYFGTFERIETLGIDILRVMFEITANPDLEVTEEGGTVLLGGEPLMPADELDYIKNNRHIADLKARLAALHAGPIASEEGLYGEALQKEIKRIEDELCDCYKKCFEALASRYVHMSENAEFDLELQLAYNASAAGDYSKVLEILNPALLVFEAKRAIGEKQLEQKRCLETIFRKYVLYINALTQQHEYEKLDDAYKTAIELIDEFDLYKLDPECLTTWQDYISFLSLRFRTEEAIEVAKGLEDVYCHRELRRKPEYGQLLAQLGTLYSAVYKNEEAEEYFKDAIDFFERTVKERSMRHINGLADAYVKLAYFYDNQNRPEAEEICHKAIALYEGTPTIATSEDKIRFHSIYTMLGHIYARNEEPELAEENYRKAIAVHGDLLLSSESEAMKELYIASYITSYSNLFLFLLLQNNLQSAGAVYEEVSELMRRYENTESNIYNTNLAMFYSNAAFYHFKLMDPDLAEEYAFKALEILDEMDKKFPHSVDFVLAQVYSNLAMVYQQLADPPRFDEAEVYHEKSLKINEVLVSQNPDAYTNTYILTSTNLAALYTATDRPDEAEGILFRNLELCKKLSESYPGRYKFLLALCYSNIANNYLQTGRQEEARPYLEGAVTVFEELTKDNIRKFYLQYATHACAFISIEFDGDKFSDLGLIHCKRFIEYSESAFALFDGEEQENDTNLPSAAFYLTMANLLLDLSEDDEAACERAREIANRFIEDPYYCAFCQVFNMEELIADIIDDDDDEDDEEEYEYDDSPSVPEPEAPSDDLLAQIMNLINGTDDEDEDK